MDISFPTNWQGELVEHVLNNCPQSRVNEIYGKLAYDDIGGGRTSSALAFVSEKEAKRQIKMIQSKGVRFNYLLNSLCMDNLEFTRPGQIRMRKLLNWVVDAQVNSVTVANPYIALWIKKNYPSLSLSVSAMANVNSVQKAQYWEDLGVEKITFPGPIVNRNFRMIKVLRKALKCKIQLIANNACLLECPYYTNHSLMNSHASQRWHKGRGFAFDYNLLMCRLQRFRMPVKFIKSDWIRPEDIVFYKALGVDSIKLVDRRLPTGSLIKILRAYQDRSYRGNLADLFHTFQGKTFFGHKNWIRKIPSISMLMSVNIFKAISFSKLLEDLEVFIDNDKLDGFLSNYPEDCNLSNCQNCGYCQSMSERAIKIDLKYNESMIYKYDEALNKLFKNGLL